MTLYRENTESVDTGRKKAYLTELCGGCESVLNKGWRKRTHKKLKASARLKESERPQTKSGAGIRRADGYNTELRPFHMRISVTWYMHGGSPDTLRSSS